MPNPALPTLLAVIAAIAAAITATPATAQQRARFDIATFDVPAGWTRTTVGAEFVLEPADKNAKVTLGRSVAIAGAIDAHGTALVEHASKAPDYRIEIQPEAGRHRRSTGRWHRFVYSEANPAKAGTFLYTTVLSVGAGGRSVSFRMVTEGTGPYEQHRQALGAMVDSVELSTTQRLERGSPPLTRYMVDEATDFLEWLVHAPLTEDQKATVEAELRRSWQQKDQDEIDGMQELLAARVELGKLPEAERELARQAVLDEALAAWKQDTDSEGARMMLAIHAAANQPIAKGEPPLTAQAVEAFAEYQNFAANQAAGCDVKLAKETRQKLVDGTAAGYAELPKEQRELIAGMPMVWAALRVAWPDLPPAQKTAYVDGWKRTESIAAIGKLLVEQKAAADRLRTAAEGMRDLQHRQAMMQAQQAQFQMMQNVPRMQNDTMRIMASNLGGNTQYVYRW